jgi:hypothetical protein
VAITALNLLGHAFFGFEQSYAQPLVALATAYSMEIVLELVDAVVNSRRPRFLGGFFSLVDFLLSAHITALAVAMLIYANDRLWPIAFATAAAIGSKAIFRVTVDKSARHVFNPSNFGIATTLLFFPWIGIAPPYHFSENIPPWGRWLLPGVIVLSGTYLNFRFTKRLPLIASWLGGFALQALLRSRTFGTPLSAGLLPMTGVAFILYTFYMVTDPATTPSSWKSQLAFGAAISSAYAFLMFSHVVFGLFFALAIVCACRGLGLQLLAAQRARARVPARPLAPAAATRSTAFPVHTSATLEKVEP